MQIYKINFKIKYSLLTKILFHINFHLNNQVLLPFMLYIYLHIFFASVKRPILTQMYADKSPKTTPITDCLSLRPNAACCIPLRPLRYLRENRPFTQISYNCLSLRNQVVQTICCFYKIMPCYNESAY